MSVTWTGPEPPPHAPPGLWGWLRILRRGLPMVLLIFGGAVVLLLLRLIERPLFGVRRPWTQHIVRFACRNALRLMGLRLQRQGKPMTGPGAVVANHSSWLDIFVLNASDRVYFVSKAEVAAWPGIGWLARITGTVFIERDRSKARTQTQIFEDRLRANHRLLFFPEGTSTDNQRVLPFKTTLFAAFQSPGLPDPLRVQPVTVVYHAPQSAPVQFYGWWGDMSFGASLIKMLACPRHGHVEVCYGAPLAVADYAGRKDLAQALETAVRTAFSASKARQTPV